MAASQEDPQVRDCATRVARCLRAAAAGIGGWVSCEASVRTSNDMVLRPAVVVAIGDPPYDGVATTGVVLVVEMHPHLASRWAGTGVPAVWAPSGPSAVVATAAGRKLVAPGHLLTVPGHPALEMPADVLLFARAEGIVVAAGR